jgi:hypothetical protein
MAAAVLLDGLGAEAPSCSRAVYLVTISRATEAQQVARMFLIVGGG